ncbi:response regulator transcription factor [Enterobacteriaceae bacterium NFIX31]|jgi:DNA-binding response OmpR family regulator
MRYLLMTDNHLLAHHFAVVCAGRGSVSETPCGPEAVRDISPVWLQERRTDALLLDLPERLTLRAPVLIAAWRARCPGVPVMVVMPGATPYTVRAVLDAGADGCHDDPGDIRVLAARVEALVRRRLGWYRTEVLDCPPLRLETATCRLFIRGEPVYLTRFEFRVLEVLVRHRGRVLSRADILMQFCPEGQVDERRFNSLNTIIGRLRRRLAPFPQVLSGLQTCRSRGYVLDIRPACPPAVRRTG